ncbi:hypothetical protein [Lewinella sp. 4G2]|uniref:hypothetical protein n=1 Tax=Lewinella sp. 4G2 TaxID=1803372 RepID=UPI0012F994B8|nr:hypothetical protein [Lewinella sp. 4G2]
MPLQSQSRKKIDKMEAAIFAEGYALYLTEKAAWNGTDIFLANYADRDNIGGYATYVADERAVCIFVDRAEVPQVIGTISFALDFNGEDVQLDLEPRPLTKDEFALYRLRQAAVVEMESNPIFKPYPNARFNIIPFLYEGNRKVYVLTGPQESGIVLIGNDYLITFDKKLRVKEAKALHASTLEFPYHGEEDTEIKATIHSHTKTSGPYITATDVCTLLLYAPYLSWGQHQVVSEDFVSILDMSKPNLLIMTQQAMDRIRAHQGGK